jgi:acetyltransferase-like isoleucine patch superfamily enzyme
MRTLSLAVGVALCLLPSMIKIPLYRLLYGYRIGKGVRIGFSPFIGVRRCRIGDRVRIGSGNLFYRVHDLEIGHDARIGFLNVVRGGDNVVFRPYTTVLRQNVFNSILERDFINPVSPVLELGTGVTVASGHWLDFSAGLRVGDHSIVGGRNSSIWTHNRQRGRPVSIGCHCYLGSEIRVAPGVQVAPFCVVALGSVLTGRYPAARALIGGNPAAVIRPLSDRDFDLVSRKTRKDIPDDILGEPAAPGLQPVSQPT